MKYLNKTLQPLTDERLKLAFGDMKHPRDFRPFVPKQKAGPELNTSRRERPDQGHAPAHSRKGAPVWQ